MKNIAKNFFIFLLAFLVIAGVLSTFSDSFEKPEEVGIGLLVSEIEAGQVQKVVVEGNELTVTLADSKEQKVFKEPAETLSTILLNYGLTTEQIKAADIQVKEKSGFEFWLSAVLPFLIPFLLIGAFIWLMMRQAQGMNQKAMMFGQSSAKQTKPDKKEKVTFADVAGAKEAKEELQEVVEFLKQPKKFAKLGAKIPKGALLLGSPGVGKTLLSRAVSGEADVPFFHISGSEFVEMFVGVGASRVRDLFRQAKKSAPCIIFIDELDAVGRQRGAGLGGSHDEREQTLNQILVEMDGFEPNVGIVVMAATNRPDVLDPALLRPGRFDRRIVIDLPDLQDREAILKIHAKGKPLDKSVNLRRVAQRTPGFSGADLSNLLNEAAILTARRNKSEIGSEEILESVERVMLGPERKSRIVSEKERDITAYHEAGHALVAHALPHTDPVQKISIISRGMAAGYTLKMPEEDKRMHPRSEFIDDLAVMLAGHATEKLIFGEVTTGATNDLRQATRLARRLVTEFGMSEKLGPRTFGEKEEMIFLGREIHERRDYSEKVAELIDKEVSDFITQAYKTALAVVKKMKPMLKKIANALIEKETLERDEFEKIVGPKIKLGSSKAAAWVTG